MADAEKQAREIPVVMQSPPEYTSGPTFNKGVRKSTVALCAYASTVTALLLAMAIFGGIMYQKTLNQCEDETTSPSDPAKVKNISKDFDSNGKKVHEDITLDYQKEVQVIRLKHEGENTEGGLVVLDYKRMITGMYLPEKDECYVIGGVGHDLGSPFLEGVEVEEEPEEEKREDDEKDPYLRKASDKPITDTSVLPAYLKETCRHKNTYWLEKTNEVGDKNREKRGVCVRCYWFRICSWFRCYYRVRCYYVWC